MKKQTAVEWLEAEVIALENYSLKELRLLFNQAKAMEKEQIIDAATWAALHGSAEQYYTSTYES
jgi:hypothetical protein